MESKEERRHRTFVVAGLFGAHTLLLIAVLWLEDRYIHLLSFSLLSPWIILALNLIGLRVFLATWQARQMRVVDRKLPLDPRFRDEAQFCDICNIVKPLRSKHCNVCGICSERFDHHCSLMGVCIGRQNHRLFYLLLIIDVVILLTSECMVLGSWWRGSFAASIIMVIVFIAFIPPFGLLVFQTWLIFSNQTTWEWMKHDAIYYLETLDEEILPFDLGCIKNGREFFFKMHLPGYLWNVPNEVYEEGYEPPPNCCNNKHYSCF